MSAIMITDRFLKAGVYVLALVLSAGAAFVQAAGEADGEYYTKLHRLQTQLAARAAAAAGNRAKLAAFEAELIAALRSGDRMTRMLSCRMLARVGSDNAVEPLAALLPDKDVSHMARYGLEGIGSGKAAAAVRVALDRVGGDLKIGMLTSLGTMKDQEAVSAIAAYVTAGDARLAAAAINALGRIADDEAVKVLQGANVAARLHLKRGLALAQCAAARAAAGEAARARQIYAKLFAADQPGRIRVLGLNGLAAVGDEALLAKVIESLKSDSPALRQAAAHMAATIDDKAAGGKLIELCPALPAKTQAILLPALASRGEARVMLPALKALKSEEAWLKQAGIRAVGMLGGEKAILPLARAAVGASRRQQEAARTYLARLTGGNIDAIILKHAKSGDARLRVEMIGSLGQRGVRRTIPELMEMTGDPQAPVAVAAFKALGVLVQPQRIMDVVGLMLKVERPAVRRSAEDAVVSIVGEADDQAQQVREIIKLYPALKGTANRCSVLNIFGVLCQDSTLETLGRALADKDGQVVSAAIRAMGKWPNWQPLNTLLPLARNSSDDKHKLLALRAYIELTARRANNRDRYADALKQFKAALALSTRAAEKRLILAGLQKVRTLGAFNLAAPLLDNKELEQEASWSMVHIAWEIYRDHPKQCRPAIRRISKLAKGRQGYRDIYNKANDISHRIDKILKGKT